MDGILSDWLGCGGGSGSAVGRSGEALDDLSEDTDIGEGWRGGFRFPGGGSEALYGFDGFETDGLSARSSLESESFLAPSMLFAAAIVPSSSSSPSSTAGLRGAGGFIVVDFCGWVLSDSVVGIRGSFEGRCGLKGGGFRLDAG